MKLLTINKLKYLYRVVLLITCMYCSPSTYSQQADNKIFLKVASFLKPYRFTYH